MSKGLYIGIAIVVILIALGYVIYTTKPTITSTTSTTSTASVPLELTDPLQVPTNTSALYLYYSSFSAKLSNGTILKYSTPGYVNLVSIQNYTQLLGYLPKNVTVESITLNLTRATITINGITYVVEIPPSVTFPVNATTSANSTMLLDMLPSVAPLYGTNQTIYVLVPSGVGLKVNLPIKPGTLLPKEAFSEIESHRANISIVGETLAYNNNTGLVTFEVSVKNTGNVPTYLMHVGLFGPFNLTIGNKTFGMFPQEIDKEIQDINESDDMEEHNGSDPFGFGFNFPGFNISNFNFTHPNFTLINQTIQKVFENISTRLGKAGIQVEFPELHGRNMSELFKNITLLNETLHHLKDKLDHFIKREEHLIKEISMYKSINFFVANNGTLYLPFSKPMFIGKINPLQIGNSTCKIEEDDVDCEFNGSMEYIPFGYLIAVNQTATLEFTGKLTLGNGLITLTPVPGNYTIFVQGNKDAFARTTFTYH